MNPIASAEALDALEFPSALEIISARAAGALAAERIRSLTPDIDRQRIAAELQRVAECLGILRRGERMEVPATPDLRGALGRLRIDGGVLELGQLLDHSGPVAAAAGCARTAQPVVV